MARTCRLTWAGGTRTCNLDYAHEGNCEERNPGVTHRRIVASLVAQERYAERVARAAALRDAVNAERAMNAAPDPRQPPIAGDMQIGQQLRGDLHPLAPPIQAVTPPVVAADDDDADLVTDAVKAPALDPFTNPTAFLNAQHNVTGGWKLATVPNYSGCYQLVSGGAVQPFPFLSTAKLSTCCGVVNIGSWNGLWNEATRAAFHLFVQMVRDGSGFSTMCIMSTTKYSQTAAIALLREAGFTEINGYNRNSGNMMSVWILKLYEGKG